MTEKELKTAVKSPCGGFFFFGEEDYLKEYYEKEIRKAVICDEGLAPFNEVIFDDETFSVPSLADALASPPMMADKRLVRVHLSSYNSLSDGDKKELLELYGEVKASPDTVLVISISPGGFDAGTEKRPTAAFKAIRDRLNAVDFPLQSEAKLVSWLSRHMAQSSLASSPEVLSQMISLCGRNMFRLGSEAEKVASYALSKGMNTVTEDVVRRVVTVTPEEDAFRLANSVLAGDRGSALDCLRNAKGRGENPIKLLASVSAVFCDMAAIAHLASGGADKYAIASALKIHEYRVGLYMKACAGIRPEALDRTVAMCAEADVKMKTSSSGYIPLERLICAALTAERK